MSEDARFEGLKVLFFYFNKSINFVLGFNFKLVDMEKHLMVLKEINDCLTQKFNNKIKNVVLFGSQISGKNTPLSDYDILVVCNEQYDWRFKNEIINSCYPIDLKFDIITDVLLISDYELNHTLRGSQPIFQNALKNGIYA